MADASIIRSLYETYLDTVETLERNRKPGEGLFGLTKGPADDPCHDRFIEDLTAAIKDYAEQMPTSAELAETLNYMYTVPLAYKELRSAYWMLIAAQGLSLDLIAGLDPADAAALFQSYGKAYPIWERLPVQRQVLTALKARIRNGA